MTGFTKGPELSLVERLLQRAEQKKRRAAYTGLPRMEAMLADARLDREAADALAEQAAVREELCGALTQVTEVMYDCFKSYDLEIGWQIAERMKDALENARAALAKAAPEKETE